MDDIFEKSYLITGLFMCILALVNLLTGYDALIHIYIFMCVGLFVFFDALNYFNSEEPLISGNVTALNAGLFIIMTGVVVGFFVELYAAYLADIWPGMVSALNFSDSDFSLQIYALVFLYGLIALPSYSLYTILNNVYSSEVMLRDEFETDYYRYFVHAGLLLLVLPFGLLFGDFSQLFSFTLFITSMLGLFLIIEYFNFRRKNQGILLNFFVKNYGRLGVFLSISGLIGLVMAVYVNGFSAISGVPINNIEILGTPVILILLCSTVVLVFMSTVSLVSESELEIQ